MNVKDQLELYKQGKRHCNCCKKIKDLSEFITESRRDTIKKLARCKTCLKIKKYRYQVKKEKIQLEEKRNTDWYKQYIKNRKKKVPNISGKNPEKRHTSIFKSLKRDVHLIFKQP